VALASLDLFAGIKAARAAGFRCLDRLAVGHARGGAGLASGPLARGGHESVVDLLEGAVA
jgi:beta-phosphoglucomutase-like phosphatase (HAD superfamily)